MREQFKLETNRKLYKAYFEKGSEISNAGIFNINARKYEIKVTTLSPNKIASHTKQGSDMCRFDPDSVYNLE